MHVIVYSGIGVTNSMFVLPVFLQTILANVLRPTHITRKHLASVATHVAFEIVKSWHRITTKFACVHFFLDVKVVAKGIGAQYILVTEIHLYVWSMVTMLLSPDQICKGNKKPCLSCGKNYRVGFLF